MKIGFVYAGSWEHAYPQINEDFDNRVWCDSDDFVMKYPRAVLALGAEPVFFYLSQSANNTKQFVHKYGFALKRVPIHFGAGHPEREISLQVLGEIAKERFDLIHHYSYYRNMRYPDMFDISAFYYWTKRYPFVTHYQGGQFPGTLTSTYLKKLLIRPRRFIKKAAIDFAARVFSVSKLEIERLTNPNHPQYYGIPFRKEKFIYLPNIVDTHLFFPMEKKEACRQVNKDPSKNYMVYVGHLREAKGIQHIIKIMPRLTKEYSNLELLLVGNGEYEKDLRGLVRDLRIEDKVLFEGPVPNQSLCPYYNIADAHLLPSYYEGLPSVILEALACNTPSVGTTVGDIPEVLSGGVGLLIPPKNEESLFMAVKQILDGGFAVNQEKGQERLHEHSYERAGKVLLETYQQILEDRKLAGRP